MLNLLKKIISFLTATDDEITKYSTTYESDKKMIYRRIMASRFSVFILRCCIPTFFFISILFTIMLYKLNAPSDIIEVYKYTLIFVGCFAGLVVLCCVILILLGWVMPSNILDKLQIKTDKFEVGFGGGEKKEQL